MSREKTTSGLAQRYPMILPWQNARMSGVSIGLLSLLGAYIACIAVYHNVKELSGAIADPTPFFVGAALFYVACVLPKVGEWAVTPLNAIASFLFSRGSFRSAAAQEQPKFALIRILFGFFMVERAFWIIFYLYPADWHNAAIVASAFVGITAAVFVMIGFLTQISLAYLILIQWQMLDGVLGTWTLGNDIARMLALLLIFANAGATLSVDSRLLSAGGWIGKVVSLLYFKGGCPTDNTLQIAKLVTLSAYWCMCVYSLMRHLGESSWMTGVAGPDLLTNNFMSRFSALFQAFFELGWWPVLIGRVALWGMLPWYALVLPLVLIGGIGRTYVIAWGCLFFALSLFILQLGWLAHFEFLFFAALFWERAFISNPGSLKVAYDDRCNLCDRTVTFIKRVDIFGRVALKPVSKNGPWLAKQGIDQEAALTDLYGVEERSDGKIVSAGYEFYLRLSRSLILLFPFYPLLRVGKWTGIGPLIYRYIADRRTRLFGVCNLPTFKPDHLPRVASGSDPTIRPGSPVVAAAYYFLALATVYLLTTPAPSFAWEGVPLSERAQVMAASSGHVYGIEPIVVFNRVDLKMSENWFTLSAIEAGDHEKLLPLLTKDGKRLAMHASDRVYFGGTVSIRRDMIGRSGCNFDLYKETFDQFASTYRPTTTRSAPTFVYRQYHQELPKDAELLRGLYRVEAPTVVCEQKFTSGTGS